MSNHALRTSGQIRKLPAPTTKWHDNFNTLPLSPCAWSVARALFVFNYIGKQMNPVWSRYFEMKENLTMMWSSHFMYKYYLQLRVLGSILVSVLGSLLPQIPYMKVWLVWQHTMDMYIFFVTNFLQEVFFANDRIEKEFMPPTLQFCCRHVKCY